MLSNGTIKTSFPHNKTCFTSNALKMGGKKQDKMTDVGKSRPKLIGKSASVGTEVFCQQE